MTPERLDECLSIIRLSPERMSASFSVAVKPLTRRHRFLVAARLFPQA